MWRRGRQEWKDTGDPEPGPDGDLAGGIELSLGTGSRKLRVRERPSGPTAGDGTGTVSRLTRHAAETSAQMTVSVLREARAPAAAFRAPAPPLARLVQRGVIRPQQEVARPARGR